MIQSFSLYRWFLGILAGGLLGLSWTQPISYTASFFGLAAALSFVALSKEERSLGPLYLSGFIFHPIGFHWLYQTIAEFGGFPPLLAAVFFFLFCALSSLQFVLFGVFERLLRDHVGRFACSAALAWVFSEMLYFRVFPWMIGHTQLALLPFIQVADIVGAYGISFLTIWVAEALLFRRSPRFARMACAAVLVLSLVYGTMRIQEFAHDHAGAPYSLLGRKQRVVLVQGNIPLAEKHDQLQFRKNALRYTELSRPFSQSDTLVVWPETALMEWIPADIGDATRDARIPFFRGGAGLLVGGLTFLDNETSFNSSIAIFPNGKIPPPYHKRVLMPFGEYTPLSGTFPFLKEVNKNAGDFQPGTGISVFPFPLRSKNGDELTTFVAPLICYEDIIPREAAEATRAGAQILVNQTNDAWFGDTIAPYQHHALSVLRAVENRRYLLRATNSGLTAVVDPTGQTIAELPTFREGVLKQYVHVVDTLTLYTGYLGLAPYWILLGSFALTLLFKRLSGHS